MAFRLAPRDDRFYSMFAGAAANLVTAAALLGDQLAAALDARPEIAARMHDVEHAADDATHEIFSAVNTTFVTPFDREDIYALAGRIDDVMDHMDEAADLDRALRARRAARRARQTRSTSSSACRRADAAGDAEAAHAAGARRLLDRDQPARERGRQRYRRLLAKLFSGEYEASRCSSSRTSSTRSRRAIDAFERSPTRSSDRRQGVLSVQTSVIVVPVVVVALAFDYTNGFHDAANAIATSSRPAL